MKTSASHTLKEIVYSGSESNMRFERWGQFENMRKLFDFTAETMIKGGEHIGDNPIGWTFRMLGYTQKLVLGAESMGPGAEKQMLSSMLLKLRRLDL